MQSFDRPSNHHAEARSPGQPTPHSPPETLSVRGGCNVCCPQSCAERAVLPRALRIHRSKVAIIKSAITEF
ncbi:hypothetical protein QQF64_002339 [Cirrhinus molitorella]|uniref:Uncharacterized protein n=1 Tax=Cirrhinus molitorella TaxID=172907 RepID=A0ABR3MPW0_9TELE